ncbi:TIGR00730 family Rossman fold protein [Oscillospiraceae bacterium HV4-5-C5C]|nr:TIGR00730 family Rossman fold protein [Oscillospiraceae bacterium HV4-5-C5C]
MSQIKSVTVYCASNQGQNPVYWQAASELGALLAKRTIKLIYGAGGRGLMGAVADGCLQAGGHVKGIIPGFMMDLEWGHQGLTELEIVPDMTVRKERLRQADAFITLPGGVGTLEELSEVWSWSSLNLLQQPIGILNINGFYDPFIQQLQIMQKEGFLSAGSLDLLLVAQEADDLLDRLESHQHPGLAKS